jgi:Secretion system C-terminal sorting domain
MKKALLILFCLNLFGTLSAQSTLWTPQGIGVLPINYDVIAISVVNKDVIWALADSLFSDPLPANFGVKVIKTTNGGVTWKAYDVVPATGRYGVDIYGIDSSVAYVTVQALNSARNNNLYKTTNGGTTWVSEYGNSYAPSAFIRFFDAKNVIIWNRHSYARSQDGGTTWTESAMTGWLNTEGMAWASTTNACTVVGDSIWAGNTSSRIAFSPDKGATWQFQNLQSVPNFGADRFVISIAFKDARNGIALGGDPKTETTYLAQTNNGGATWTSLTTYPFKIGEFIEYIPGTSGGFVVGAFTGGLTAYTTNFGKSWIKIDDQVTNSLRFINPQTGWIGKGSTKAGGPAMYKWNGGNILSSIKVFEAEEIGLKISPNPTSRFLNIEYSEDFKPSFLAIYDAIGRTVFQKNTLTQTTQSLDLQGFANGIYLVQLKSSEGYVSKKIIVEH